MALGFVPGAKRGQHWDLATLRPTGITQIGMDELEKITQASLFGFRPHSRRATPAVNSATAPAEKKMPV